MTYFNFFSKFLFILPQYGSYSLDCHQSKYLLLLEAEELSVGQCELKPTLLPCCCVPDIAYSPPVPQHGSHCISLLTEKAWIQLQAQTCSQTTLLIRLPIAEVLY